jgi:transposase
VIATTQVSNTSAGFAELVTWTRAHAPGPAVMAGVEGTRSYGRGLTAALAAAGITVVEVEQPKRRDRRKGKSDPIDAHVAALAVLRTDTTRLTQPRADGDREALRILLVAREEMTTLHTAQNNRLKDLLRAGDDTDKALARRSLTLHVLRGLTTRELSAEADAERRVRHREIGRLANSLLELDRETKANTKDLTEIVTDLAPALLGRCGVGPVTAAQTLISWSHDGRVRDEAAFAMLAGTAPIPASSGQHTRHRLNRGGDRKLNSAIHTIAITRWRCEPRTKAYIERRRAQGKTDREIRRCLKRYITRELFRTLSPAA